MAMRSKRLLQIFVLLALLFSPMGNVQPASASSQMETAQDALIVNRDLNFWDATYVGFVTDSIFEKWRFEFTETHSFVLTASPITGGLVPALTLLGATDNVLAQGTGSLTSTQPAGTYFVQVQPQSGSGFYFLTIREVVNTQPSASTVVNPSSLNVGESALATVSLDNVPAGGYTGAEFTCTYDQALLEVSHITVGSLFGADPAAAINGPQNGSFIVAIAGSNGNKATTSGPVFTFDVTALQAGQTSVECTVRVSTGNNVLTSLSSTGTDVTITGTAPTATTTQIPTAVGSPTATSVLGETATPTTVPGGTQTATATPVPGGTESPTATTVPGGTATATSTPDPNASPTASATPIGSSTPVESATPTFTSTPVESPTPTWTSTPAESPTPDSTSTPVASPTPLPAGTLNGKVIATKPVTVSLYDATNTLVASVPANPDGTFSLTAPAGTYAVTATAPGSLSAAGSATLTSGGTTSLPDVTLSAGDIDGNNVIDQLDAMTIGMNYNGSTPAAADLNNDGTINVLDLELLAANYRDTGPIVWQ
jgi:hypothetical protein